MAPDDQDKQLRAVALKNSQTILAARQRAEGERDRAQGALELKTKELARALATMRATFESTTDGILVTDSGGHVEAFNQRFTRLWGLPEAILQSMDHQQWLPAIAANLADPAAFSARIAEIYATAPDTTFDVLQLADGRVFERFSTVQTTEGERTGRVWNVRDVTERRQEHEGRFRLAALVESSDDAIISKSLEGVISTWNDGAQRVFGYTAAEVVGKSITILIPPDRIHEEPEILAQIRRGDRINHFETERVRKDGGRIDVSVTASPIRDDEGRIIGVSKIARDITQAKRIERENLRLVEVLKESDRRKDEFLAILAHELRNPLAPIRNAAQILRTRSGEDPELGWATEVMDRQLAQMTRLVDDLLDVSRISRGKVPLQQERVDLATIITSALDGARPLIEKAGQVLTVAAPAHRIFLHADPVRLSQVVLNLLSNAAKYTNPGGRISLTTEEDGEWVLIRVKDSGIGLPADRLDDIFEMFVQVDSSLERSHSGLGIGLTLVRQLVAMHGGTVAAQSDGPDKGSEFIVRLPTVGALDEPRSAAAASEEQASSGPSTLRILVVDDSRDSAESLVLLLRLLGHETRAAYDGLEAVHAAEDFRPDVVLLDIGLPKLNGYEAARRIREVHGADLTLIALTGWGQAEDRRTSREAGFDHHLTKPVEFEVLLGLLKTAKKRPNH
ncbi:MAG: PAS domain S-box protein [Acidobacteriota bacterium]